MHKIKKLLGRIWRILTLRKGVYARMGRHNTFCGPTYLHEMTQMGNYNYFGPYTMSLHSRIGSYCTFGPGTKLGQGQHNTDYFTAYPAITTRNLRYDIAQKETVIENDVWTGANAVIMAGVTVGTGAVIGANAVVTHDIPPYCVAVGVPARVIRTRFPEQTVKTLLESRWWEQELAAAADKVAELWETEQKK